MQAHVPELAIKKSRLQGNKAGSGGGIRALSAVVAIEESHLHDNEANGPGGGIDIDGCDDGTNLTVTNTCTLFNNRAESGGGIYIENCPAYLGQSSVSANRAIKNGGGISCQVGDDQVAADDVQFIQNTAAVEGGAISSSLDLRLADCRFARNRAASGGGVKQDNKVDIKRTEFEENIAATEGGACVITADNTALDSNTFTGNSAGRGGALLLSN